MIQKACLNCTVLREHPIWMVYNPQVFKGSAALRNLGITNVSRIAALENKSFFYIKSSEAMSTYVYYSPPPQILWIAMVTWCTATGSGCWKHLGSKSSGELLRPGPCPQVGTAARLCLLVQPAAPGAACCQLPRTEHTLLESCKPKGQHWRSQYLEILALHKRTVC